MAEKSLPVSAAILVAGGSGSRFGGDKLSVLLEGKPLFVWSLIAFEQNPFISSIVLVTSEARKEEFRAIAQAEGISKLVAVVNGGSHRNESVIKGLHALHALPNSADLVAIHDAARPLVTADLITRCLEVAAEMGASSAAAPVSDTLHQADQEGCAVRTVDRTGLWGMQTPQVFRMAPLIELLKTPGIGKPTDEVSMALAAGWRIPFVENLEPNIKVTWPADLALTEAVLRYRRAESQAVIP
ncbi:MAG: 2-C-methyl-D-erythritol 4-phosphate cytidylyltransferase [Chthoniobacterales bacterium]|nr:2-C-methyl-D-erythritol 4-phosphate cytidylyltransferase [Chthoniobacterales bacterium]